MASIRPEHLLNPTDYKSWARLKGQVRCDAPPLPQETKSDSSVESRESDVELDSVGAPSETLSSMQVLKQNEFKEFDEATFHLVSKKAWSDLLIQIYKVCEQFEIC